MQVDIVAQAATHQKRLRLGVGEFGFTMFEWHHVSSRLATGNLVNRAEYHADFQESEMSQINDFMPFKGYNKTRSQGMCPWKSMT